ncbi:unnamed protein product [Rotaria socialis]|uniref:Proton-coupled zinc antiporter SLC30A9, mitochondrial n=2 Tax=Rotaria socialis TaxID=392032 RepID=A0A821ITE9_9BILA|nr:unnamed protein product [Rotaria socialis]
MMYEQRYIFEIQNFQKIYHIISESLVVGSGEFGISVTWSRPGDGDIVVTTPSRKSIYYGNKGPSVATDQGQLDHDDTRNTGPENIFWNVTAPTGVYHICFQQYSFSVPSNVTNPITATFQIRRPNAVTQTLTKTFVNGDRIVPNTCRVEMSREQPKLSSQRVQELRDAFNLFDRDKSGTISSSELHQILSALNFKPTDSLVRKVMKEMDIDGNGTIMGRIYERKFTNDEMHRAFKCFDADDSGYITRDELREVLHQMNQNVSEERIADALSQIDTDHDEIGLGLSIFGVGFIFLGMIFLFDKGLLAVGNILFLAGLSMIIGFERTLRFFFQRNKIKATLLFFGGISIVLFGYPLVGMIFEIYGFFLLFGGFIPIAINFLRRLPIIGSILLLPGIRQVVDRLCESLPSFKAKYIIFTYTAQHNILRILSSTPFGSYRYDASFRQNVNRVSKRTESTTSNNSNALVSSDKNVPSILKVRTHNGGEVDDVTVNYLDNKLITAVRAMHEYLLKPSDLETLQQYKTRSPYTDVADSSQMLTVYRRGDVEKRAYQIWGTPEILNIEKAKRAKARQDDNEAAFSLKKSIRDYQKRLSFLENASFDNRKSVKKNILTTGSGKVVIAAVIINATNAVVKTIGWLFTGSASLFSEAVHSIADTCNQLILTFGLWQSIKKPNPEHPYGYSNMTYISSLISGVGIFCFGTGLAWYHGIMVLLHPQEMHSVVWGIALLSGSLISEGATLYMAANEIRASAKETGMKFWEYVGQGYKPNVNVVLLEDLAAVLGVCVAATAMGLSLYLQSPIPDAVGSLIVGCILGGVASFIIYSNTAALVGRSIHPNQIEAINNDLENDRMVRALYDIKATDMGSQSVMFKAEVDIDGREIARSYLERIDIEIILKEIQKVDTIELAEAFLLKHGENVVDRVGAEIDRIERNLRKKHPYLRHVDLEVL